jgi:hypothetical protein
MDASAFWNVISNYNSSTLIFQIILMVAIAVTAVITFKKSNGFYIKLSMGLTNLFIGFIHFGFFGTEPIQQFFAYPLYIAIGIMFINDAFYGNNSIGKLNPIQYVLFSLFILYPFISLMLGNSFPRMVVYIMPCPIVSLSIAFYSIMTRKNTILLILLTVWGLTGVKAFIVGAYEDTILFLAGIYSLYMTIANIKMERPATVST